MYFGVQYLEQSTAITPINAWSPTSGQIAAPNGPVDVVQNRGGGITTDQPPKDGSTTEITNAGVIADGNIPGTSGTIPECTISDVKLSTTRSNSFFLIEEEWKLKYKESPISREETQYQFLTAEIQKVTSDVEGGFKGQEGVTSENTPEIGSIVVTQQSSHRDHT